MGIKQTIIETGEELVEKTTRPGSLYLRTALRKVRRSWKRRQREPETIEGKATFWLTNFAGDAKGLTTEKAQRYIDSGYVTVGGKGKDVERHNQILGHRLRAFGGESEYQLLRQRTSLEKTKDKTGQYIWTYTDWEFVDDMYGNMINDYEWYPHHKVLQDMNNLWKKYSKFNPKYNMKNITSSFCDVDRITGI